MKLRSSTRQRPGRATSTWVRSSWNRANRKRAWSCSRKPSRSIPSTRLPITSSALPISVLRIRFPRQFPCWRSTWSWILTNETPKRPNSFSRPQRLPPPQARNKVRAISKSMTAVEASSFPSVFKEGWLRLNKKIPFLSSADGVVSKFQQNKDRYADLYKEATRPFHNHPVCAAKERDLFIKAQPPLLENGGEWTRLAINSIPPFQRP